METSQYASALPFINTNLANVVAEFDVARIKSYKLYEDLYHNRPETLELIIRGDDEDGQKIYLPATKKIIEAVNRFLAVDFGFVVDPDRGTPEEQAAMQIYMDNLFNRERIYTKFSTQKRYGLIRGDALWHITADDTKADGQRISVHELNPANYFPISDPNDANRIIGCHIVDLVQDPRTPEDRTKQVARRQTYRKVLDAEGRPTGTITSELTTWAIGKWDDRVLKADEMEQVSTIKPVFELPAEITQLPVYHIRNGVIPDSWFGSSQVAGVETILAALNQSVSDEDLTLVMQGLGMYWTDSAPPQDEEGNDVSWQIGPRNVIEVGSGQNFGRVTGVSSIAPFIDHMKFIEQFAESAQGISDVAAGRVDVQVAESGISLRLQLAPILQANAEKEQEMLGVYDQMFWDLTHMWLPAYEGLNFPDVRVASVVGDPMPINREARIKEIIELVGANLMPIAMAQAELTKLGYNFQVGDDQQVIRDAVKMAIAGYGADPFANRAAQETGETE